MTAYIATVGTSEARKGDIVAALSLSAGQMTPGFVLLLATEKSRPNADAILQQLGRDDSNSLIYVLEAEPEHAQNIYNETIDVITRTLSRHHIRPDDATADITSGTKPMSAALTLAAVKLGIGYLRYVAVEKTANKEVCTGTEELRTFRPLGFRASLLLDSAVNLMRQYRFDAVRQLLEPMPEHLLSESERATRTCLLCLARAYSHWDMFRHTHFQGEYGKARFGGLPELQQFRPQPDTVRTVLELGVALEQGKPTDLAVVDLINNARRRIEEGKFDDATARLYRATEMLAQWRLHTKHGIDTSDVDINKVPQASRQWLEYSRDNTDKKIRVACERGYRLLFDLGDPLGPAFKDIKGNLRTRNDSILAHGLTPVTEEVCNSLRKAVEKMAKEAIADYDSKSALLRFPWSR